MVELTIELLNQIIDHCQKGKPKESCGILAGKPIAQGTTRIEKVYPMQNVAETPETCYFMDPKEQLTVMKEMRTLGLEMVGIYHSHLGSPAEPSARDVELAFYSEVVYVIVSLTDKGNPSIRTYRIIESNITEETIL
ncbi:MAG: M67 family metallopeptidase [bacterium]|nr:M67 family metallopeptidase [bacterium]